MDLCQLRVDARRSRRPRYHVGSVVVVSGSLRGRIPRVRLGRGHARLTVRHRWTIDRCVGCIDGGHILLGGHGWLVVVIVGHLCRHRGGDGSSHRRRHAVRSRRRVRRHLPVRLVVGILRRVPLVPRYMVVRVIVHGGGGCFWCG